MIFGIQSILTIFALPMLSLSLLYDAGLVEKTQSRNILTNDESVPPLLLFVVTTNFVTLALVKISSKNYMALFNYFISVAGSLLLWLHYSSMNPETRPRSLVLLSFLSMLVVFQFEILYTAFFRFPGCVFTDSESVLLSSLFTVGFFIACFTAAQLSPGVTEDGMLYFGASVLFLFIYTSVLLLYIKKSAFRVALFFAFMAFSLYLVLPHTPMALMEKVAHELLQRRRIFIAIYWLSVIVTMLYFAPRDLKRHKRSVSMYRKYFHFVSVAIIVPVAFFDMEFLVFSLFLALFVLLLIELMRNMFPSSSFVKRVENFYSDYRDRQDRGKVYKTHIYLLLGLLLPIIVHLLFVKNEKMTGKDFLCALSGVTILGFCDSFAAIIGVKYGKIHFKSGRKTLEGSLGGFFGALAFQTFIFYLKEGEKFFLNYNGLVAFVKILVVSLLGSFLEFSLDENDNLVLPILFYACCLISNI